MDRFCARHTISKIPPVQSVSSLKYHSNEEAADVEWNARYSLVYSIGGGRLVWPEHQSF